jgi:hypothetical protein
LTCRNGNDGSIAAGVSERSFYRLRGPSETGYRISILIDCVYQFQHVAVLTVDILDQQFEGLPGGYLFKFFPVKLI